MNHENDDPQDTKQLEGRYANYFKVGQNAYEFLLNFGQFCPDTEKEHFHTRIVCSPYYANALLKILQKSIDQYEQTFVSIPEKDE